LSKSDVQRPAAAFSADITFELDSPAHERRTARCLMSLPPLTPSFTTHRDNLTSIGLAARAGYAAVETHALAHNHAPPSAGARPGRITLSLRIMPVGEENERLGATVIELHTERQ